MTLLRGRTVRYVARRLASTLVVLLVIATLSFVIFQLLPSDVSQASCGKPCTAQRRAEVRQFLGYDHSVLVQLWDFVRGVVVGRSYGEGGARVDCSAPCFGYSFRLSDTVASLIGQRFPITASIAVGGALVWLFAGVVGGVVAALRRGTALDRAALASTVVGVSAPTYLVGLAGIYLLGFKLDVLPVGNYVPFTASPGQWAYHLVLPWLVIAFTEAAIYTRFTRSQLLETMSEDYVRTARAKGLRERRVVVRHGLRNALLPVVTLFGLDLGVLLGGAVITEKIFSMQGLGALLVDSINNLDLPVVLGITLFSAVLIVLANLVVDIAYAVLDPRITESA
ncbi:peptide/nickel transport system permease protein [Jatrophihabitans endophyticus]|uniref:Peptide/nickel transport system permease protein n=1 Tax=Jatrophihabitans endophyticus TaxID=1206085 RepID=A0A1M5KNM9_9ACTN|nr:ABC transporter permease [Jatrophihabitans endophyticus]SHG54326.1 peptide/nickel transport system permease protein [Jatrophihabitans endophyticus]